VNEQIYRQKILLLKDSYFFSATCGSSDYVWSGSWTGAASKAEKNIFLGFNSVVARIKVQPIMYFEKSKDII